MVGNGTSGIGNSVYSHLTWKLPCVSVLMSNEDSEPEPTAPQFTLALEPPATQPGPLLLSMKPVWPQYESISNPNTALAGPTCPMMSNRPRVRPYAWVSRFRPTLTSYALMFCANV